MEMLIIPTEKMESFQADLNEIKSMLKEKKNQTEADRWNTKQEAKTKLHVCMKTLDHYLSKGILPYSRFAGKIYIKASDIEAHLQRNYITK